MSIPVKDRKLLWGKSGSVCAICNKPLTEQSNTVGGSHIIIGEECHIVAQSLDGPRGDNPLPLDQRDFYDNLILLCASHHIIIDTDTSTYTVELLKQIKNDHENRIHSMIHQNTGSIFATFVSCWENMCHVDNWNAETSNFLFGQRHHVSKAFLDDIQKFCDYYASVQGQSFFQQQSLNVAFSNFVLVYKAFENLFFKYATTLPLSNDTYYLPKFYHQGVSLEEQDRMFLIYDNISKDLHNLLAELSRAGNYIIDNIRMYIDPNFRRAVGGYLQYEDADLLKRALRILQYSDADIATLPFSTLEQFKSIVSQRDYYY